MTEILTSAVTLWLGFCAGYLTRAWLDRRRDQAQTRARRREEKP